MEQLLKIEVSTKEEIMEALQNRNRNKYRKQTCWNEYNA